MTEKSALVTGATGGIGLHIAQGLAAKGIEVVLTGRDEARGEKAVAGIRESAGHDRVSFIPVDHSLVGGNIELARRISTDRERLDILVNNVGAQPTAKRQVTSDGYELSLALNFIGQFALTDALLPLLRASGPARIVNVSSAAHTMWKPDPFEDVQSEKDFVGLKAYGHTKLLQVLWTFALARRLTDDNILVNATNPGAAWTPGSAKLTPEAVPAWKYIFPIVQFFRRRASAEKAAGTPLMLAVSPEVDGVTGKYYESKGKPAKPSKWANSVDYQERAYELGAQLTEQAPSRPSS